MWGTEVLGNCPRLWINKHHSQGWNLTMRQYEVIQLSLDCYCINLFCLVWCIFQEKIFRSSGWLWIHYLAKDSPKFLILLLPQWLAAILPSNKTFRKKLPKICKKMYFKTFKKVFLCLLSSNAWNKCHTALQFNISRLLVNFFPMGTAELDLGFNE